MNDKLPGYYVYWYIGQERRPWGYFVHFREALRDCRAAFETDHPWQIVRARDGIVIAQSK